MTAVIDLAAALEAVRLGEACWRCGGAGTVGCVDYSDPCPCCEPARTSASPAHRAVDRVAGAADAAISLGERVHARAVALRGHAEVAAHTAARAAEALWRDPAGVARRVAGVLRRRAR